MIERWFEDFMLLERTADPDGLGGETVSWTDSVPFRGALSLTAAAETDMAGRPVLLETPVLLHEFDLTLAQGDRVRREKTGAVYRVSDSSDNLRAPAFSGLRFAQVQVERVVPAC